MGRPGTWRIRRDSDGRPGADAGRRHRGGLLDGAPLGAWGEQSGVRVVGIANRTRERAEELARRYDIGAVYGDPAHMLDELELDVVDIISHPEAHATHVRLAADRGIPVICQKPLAPTLAEAEGLATFCRERGVPLLVHENFRWQAPVRELARLLRDGAIGRPFRARIEFTTGFPVFEYQPALRDYERLVLADLGVHLLDVCRFLFGEAVRVSAETRRVDPGIRGEDVATVLLRMEDDVAVVCEMSFSSRLEADPFPEMLVRVEGERGSLTMVPPGDVRLTDERGTRSHRPTIPAYPWADPDYALAQAAMVPCIANLLGAIRGEHDAETAADDNLRTLRLVEAAYASATSGRTIDLEAVEP